ncbi:hypothetical protein Hanom_Chr00s000002g01601171 [Helianthus anomalus]
MKHMMSATKAIFTTTAITPTGSVFVLECVCFACARCGLWIVGLGCLYRLLGTH